MLPKLLYTDEAHTVSQANQLECVIIKGIFGMRLGNISLIAVGESERAEDPPSPAKWGYRRRFAALKSALACFAALLDSSAGTQQTVKSLTPV